MTPSSQHTSPTSHRAIVTQLRQRGLPSVLSPRDRAQDLFARCAVLLWSLLTFLVSLAFAVRVFAILEDTPLTGTEADEYLPEEAYAPFGAAIIFFCLVPLVALLVWFLCDATPASPPPSPESWA